MVEPLNRAEINRIAKQFNVSPDAVFQMGEIHRNGQTFTITPLTFSRHSEDFELQVKRVQSLIAAGNVALFSVPDNRFILNQKIVNEIKAESCSLSFKPSHRDSALIPGNQQDEIDLANVSGMDDEEYQNAASLVVKQVEIEQEGLLLKVEIGSEKKATEKKEHNETHNPLDQTRLKANEQARTSKNSQSNSFISLAKEVGKNIAAIMRKAQNKYSEHLKEEREKEEKSWNRYDLKKEVEERDREQRENRPVDVR